MLQGLREILVYKEGQYKIPEEVAEKSLQDTYKEKVEKECGGSSEEINKLIEMARKQMHGTSLVVFENNGKLNDEMKRLDRVGRLRRIRKKKLDELELLSVTSIDGALFMDLEGWCYAIGVILDGRASVKGDRGRGSRYNSMVTYVNQINKRKENCFGIVISEDKKIDIITTTTKS